VANTTVTNTVAPGYGTLHKALHWIVFGLIVAQYTVGSIMPHIGNKTLDEGWVHWHFLVGTSILFFLVLRFAWRLISPVPAEPDLPTWQLHLSRLTHVMLYVLLFVMTFLGWAATSYRGWEVTLFGVIPLPPLAAKGTEWAHEAGDIHNTLVYVLLAFILLHIAGALYHHFVMRDRVMQRMLPGG